MRGDGPPHVLGSLDLHPGPYPCRWAKVNLPSHRLSALIGEAAPSRSPCKHRASPPTGSPSSKGPCPDPAQQGTKYPRRCSWRDGVGGSQEGCMGEVV